MKELDPRELYLENRRLQKENSRLETELLRDDLTGLFNARCLRNELEACVKDLLKKKKKPALIFLDVDHFKEINEQHGHEAAGKVLGQVGGRIAALIRANDIAFRYGGDEFVVLVSGGRSGALKVGERLRKGLARQNFHVLGLKGRAVVNLTVSLGVRVINSGDQPSQILEAADRAMFEAKRKSRNVLVAA